MAQVRFLDQVPVGVYNPNGGNGGAGTIDIYQDGILVSSSVPYINISGSATVSSFTDPSNPGNGVTVLIQGVGFPFSGSAVITGSLVISGSAQPLIIQTLPVQSGPFVVTYDPDPLSPTFGQLGFVNATNGSSGVAGSSGIAGHIRY
jgi:hypothetical protein